MSMKAKVFGVVGALVLFGVATGAEARPHGWSEEREWSEDAPRQVYRKHRSKRAHAARGKHRTARAYRTAGTSRNITTGPYRNVGARPGAWCGWWMRTQRGGGPEYNLAWNWSRRGQPTEPKVGAVVVWRHHVGEITGRAKNGQWIVRSGNDGGRVRERARSVSGAVFRIL